MLALAADAGRSAASLNNLMKRKILKLVLISVALLLSHSVSSFARGNRSQSKDTENRKRICELNSQSLDELVRRFQPADKRIFIIAKLGRGEVSRRLNRVRLQSIRNYLISCKGIAPEKITVAEGERNLNEGRVEIYTGGELQFILLANRRRNICLAGCGN